MTCIGLFGCSNNHDDTPYGLMWYRPSKPPAKTNTLSIGTTKYPHFVDRAASNPSAAGEFREPGLTLDRQGYTASIGSSEVHTGRTSAPWEPTQAQHYGESTVQPGIGGNRASTSNFQSSLTVGSGK